MKTPCVDFERVRHAQVWKQRNDDIRYCEYEVKQDAFPQVTIMLFKGSRLTPTAQFVACATVDV